MSLGIYVGSMVRLVLTTMVLAVPTLLMGGTLPAAARALQTNRDASRRMVALLYAVNTLGAVTGCVLATFAMFEVFGTLRTLWIACLLNGLIAMLARHLARQLSARGDDSEVVEPAVTVPETSGRATAAPAGPGLAERAPVSFVLAASCAVGFAFFLMELVWYRMLGPLLGGSVYTFGLILAVALLGLALGSTYYTLFRKDRPATVAAFAYTCLLQAACIVIPYALGDRIAVLTLMLKPLGVWGFWGHVLVWAIIACIVVLPAAIVAGAQFPLIIALLGRGREAIGRQIGLAYAWNTVGAIAGALAGGFGLLPLLSAPGAWRLVTYLLLVLGCAALLLSARRERAWRFLLLPGAVATVVIGLVAFSDGPTAAWRHSSIGTGRVSVSAIRTPNGLKDWVNAQRRAIAWEAEGVESSVAMDTSGGLAFVINGKVDGNARSDAGTQVMGELIGALRHGQVRSSMVVGLGTGSTAGWLGAIPGMDRVDVVELEGALLEIARACAPVAKDVLNNAKVHVHIGDAREALLTSSRDYDLIVSEPSNPYRAGIASLYTKDFYQAVRKRLAPNGVFLQWIQAYEVDGETLRTVYATLASVYPSVEVWQLKRLDLLFIAGERPLPFDVPSLRKRIQSEPYREALRVAWRVTDLEGVLGHYVAGPALAPLIREEQGHRINTDDHNWVEFGFARGINRATTLEPDQIRTAARLVRAHRPKLLGGRVDWRRVDLERAGLSAALGRAPSRGSLSWRSDPALAQAYKHYAAGQLKQALASFHSRGVKPTTITEYTLVAEALADAGNPDALAAIEQVRRWQPIEADVIEARLRLRQGALQQATRLLESAFVAYRRDPWPAPWVMSRGLKSARQIAAARKELGPTLFRALQQPFAVMAIEEERRFALLSVGYDARRPALCVKAIDAFGPHVPWTRSFLEVRLRCFKSAGDPRLTAAEADMAKFLEAEGVPFLRPMGSVN